MADIFSLFFFLEISELNLTTTNYQVSANICRQPGQAFADQILRTAILRQTLHPAPWQNMEEARLWGWVTVSIEEL